jgi:hypothetical protein
MVDLRGGVGAKANSSLEGSPRAGLAQQAARPLVSDVVPRRAGALARSTGLWRQPCLIHGCVDTGCAL